MKKLMMIAAVVLATVSANAANVSWKSGDMMRAASTDGGWSATKYMSDATAATMTALFFQIDDAAAWTAAQSMSQEQLYKAYSSQTATLSKSTTSDAVTLKTDPATVGKTYNGVIIYTYTDADLGNKEFYMATTVSKYVEADNKYSVGDIGKNLGSSTGWQAVPEPTSGLLLLIGMAGLALRRRRA